MREPRSWDLFCRVVDNFGDAGVTWRLARELAATGAEVRLWIDDLASLGLLAPDVSRDEVRQQVQGIDVRRWTAEWAHEVPSDVCIEAFGCGLPEAYVAAMAAREPRTLWIVLEYLSAEPWVREHHAFASPHPRWPVPRFFFFPGFEPGTGGVLHEPGVLERRAAHDAAARDRYWRDVGFDPPAPSARVAFMFAYAYAPLAPLVAHWMHEPEPWVLAVPEGRLASVAAQTLGAGEARAGMQARAGSVELRVLPFVAQPRFDEALWSADCLFVRGEDSFVRAQWAQAPFVWHIYPQAERVHWRKLDAFLDLYCTGMPEEAAAALRDFWHAWNQADAPPVTVGSAWRRYWASRDALEEHARKWARRLAAVGGLAENLANFCRGKLK